MSERVDLLQLTRELGQALEELPKLDTDEHQNARAAEIEAAIRLVAAQDQLYPLLARLFVRIERLEKRSALSWLGI